METPLSTIPPHAMPVPGEKRNSRLIALLLALLLLLGFLLYMYWMLTRPPEPAEAPKVEGITSLFSIYGWGKNRLNAPDGVAFDGSGNIYISDTGNSRGVAFNRNGQFLFVFGQRTIKAGIQEKKLFFPLGLDIDPDNGDIYVAQMQASRISVFSGQGKWKRNIIADRPIRVKIVRKNLYVTTPGSVWIMNKKGKVLQSWGTKGKLFRQFEHPNGIGVDKTGNVFVSDTENNRVQILDKKGKLVGGIGEPLKNMNQSERLFGLNMGLAIDEQQRVYVVDAFHHTIRVFDHDGNDYGELGQQGSMDGQFNYPSDIAYRGNGVFAIADKWNDRVQVVDITPPAKPQVVQGAPATPKAKANTGTKK